MATTDDKAAPVGTAEVKSEGGGIVVIALIGEIDLSNVERVRELITPSVSGAGHRLVFELGALDFLDSSGIALLLWAAAQTETVELRQPSPIVRRIIEVTGLTEILHMDAS
jgi:anti-anti-sigma factor